MPMEAADPSAWLRLHRTVRFGDTDAAGVMHFHQLLRWCHEAYEESLERFGLPPTSIFPGPSGGPPEGLPIVHCSADYWRPLACGDSLVIELRPSRINQGSFELSYLFRKDQQNVARALTRHVSILAGSHKVCPLPAGIIRWIKASADTPL